MENEELAAAADPREVAAAGEGTVDAEVAADDGSDAVFARTRENSSCCPARPRSTSTSIITLLLPPPSTTGDTNGLRRLTPVPAGVS